jgi:hypothetical protein
MNLKNSIASLAAVAALSASPEASATEKATEHGKTSHHPSSEVLIGTEVNNHNAAFQAKYLQALDPHFKAGVAMGIGADYHGAPSGALEGVLSYGLHFTPNLGAAAELSLGGGMIKSEGRNHIEPLAKLGLVGEIATGTRTKLYAGPYIEFTPSNTMAGGTAGVIIDL